MLDHTKFIPNSHEEVATLRAIQRDLPYDLVEALTVEFLSDGADATLPN